MALQKSFTLPHGVTADYVKIAYAPADYVGKRISVHFALYLSATQAAANPAAPLVPIFAKLRLEGAKFDQYLATAVLALSDAEDPFRASLYAAAKAESVICDFPPGDGQPNVFADAEDV